MRKPVAIVIPIWKEELSEFEKISFQQCCTILKKYTFFLASYRGVNLSKFIAILDKYAINYRIVYFSESSFASRENYSRLIISVRFYSRFIRYKYILLFQLDCFVFRDELMAWTEKGYSYIGAPWLEGYNLAKYGDSIIGVGNGGFSLRSIGAHLRVLLSFRYIRKPKPFTINCDSFCPFKFFKRWFTWLKNLTIENNAFFLFNNYCGNEDIFWGKIVPNNFSWFTIPGWETAALFSVEVQPEYFFVLNNYRIPFGCHAWWKYDLGFWKPYIEKFGYNLESYQ